MRRLLLPVLALLLVGCSPVPAPGTATPSAIATAPATSTPSPSQAPSAMALATAAVPAASAAVWERYGPIPSDLSFYTDDLLLTFSPQICTDVRAGKIETGFTHGFLTGGNLPKFVRPQALNVWQAAHAITLGCPELAGNLVTLLDSYDAAHGPY